MTNYLSTAINHSQNRQQLQEVQWMGVSERWETLKQRLSDVNQHDLEGKRTLRTATKLVGYLGEYDDSVKANTLFTIVKLLNEQDIKLTKKYQTFKIPLDKQQEQEAREIFLKLEQLRGKLSLGGDFLPTLATLIAITTVEVYFYDSIVAAVFNMWRLLFDASFTVNAIVMFACQIPNDDTAPLTNEMNQILNNNKSTSDIDSITINGKNIPFAEFCLLLREVPAVVKKQGHRIVEADGMVNQDLKNANI